MHRILILADYYYPGYKAGGPIQSIFNLTTALERKLDIHIITRDRDSGDTKKYDGISSDKWNKVNNHRVYYLDSKQITKRKVTNVIDELDPDFIYLNSFFSPLSIYALLWTKNRNTNVLLAPRGELYDSALKFKALKKKLYLAYFKLFLNTRNITFQATNDQEQKAVQKIIGAKTPIFSNTNTGKLIQPEFFEKRQESVFKIITVARINPIKNLHFFSDVLASIRDREIEWNIYGVNNNVEYSEKIKKAVIESENIHIGFKGTINNNKIAHVIQQHDLFVLPSLSENFGHAILESFIAGVPVIISDQTPWKNLQDKNVGYELPARKDIWEEKLKTIMKLDPSTLESLRKCSYQYGKEIIAKDYSADRFLSFVDKKTLH